MEAYLYVKSLHLIFVITWFAGLFYIVRLLVYHAEALEQKTPEEQAILIPQYQLMEYRLWYIITWPSAILASLFAFWLLYLNSGLLQLGFFQIKLGFVALLYIYQLYCQRYINQALKGALLPTSSFFRLWNEGATIILIAVVFLIIVRDAIYWMYGVLGIMGLAVVLTVAIKAYKKIRERNPTNLKP